MKDLDLDLLEDLGDNDDSSNRGQIAQKNQNFRAKNVLYSKMKNWKVPIFLWIII